MRILSASADPEEWDAVVARLPDWQRDVHFTSAYGRVQEAANQGRAILAVHEFEERIPQFVAQPFLMRRIEDTEFFDLTNLYGFGGPVTSARPVFSNGYGYAFRQLLQEWARHAGVVSEYCVLHPLMADAMLPMLVNDNVLFTKQVVVIEDLSSFTLDRCSRRVKRGFYRARGALTSVECNEDPFAFRDLYDLSMTRRGAAQRWRYDIQYWLAHKHEDVGAKWYFVAPYYHRGLLVVGLGGTAYAHFLGTDGMWPRAGLDELLYFTAAQDLASQGFERFHLGGGLTEREDDSLLMFKSGFSETRYSVGTYRRVFMPDVYEALVTRSKTGSLKTDWFPAYRAA